MSSPRAFFVILGLAIFIANPTYAKNTLSLWEGGDGPPTSEAYENQDNLKTIRNCIKNTKDRQTCKSLELSAEGPNWGAIASQYTDAWSVIGEEYIAKSIKQNPSKAAAIKATQKAWHTYTKEQCDSERETATYEDDDAEGNHPPSYDWITYSSCLYGKTMDRVLELENQSRAN